MGWCYLVAMLKGVIGMLKASHRQRKSPVVGPMIVTYDGKCHCRVCGKNTAVIIRMRDWLTPNYRVISYTWFKCEDCGAKWRVIERDPPLPKKRGLRSDWDSWS